MLHGSARAKNIDIAITIWFYNLAAQTRLIDSLIANELISLFRTQTITIAKFASFSCIYARIFRVAAEFRRLNLSMYKGTGEAMDRMEKLKERHSTLYEDMLPSCPPNVQEYLEETINNEYEFQRNLVNSYSLLPLLTILAATATPLVAFIATHRRPVASNVTGSLDDYLIITMLLSTTCSLFLAARLTRGLPHKAATFAIEEELACMCEGLHLSTQATSENVENSDTSMALLASLRAKKIALITHQTSLYRKENRQRARNGRWLASWLWICIVTGIALTLARLPPIEVVKVFNV